MKKVMTSYQVNFFSKNMDVQADAVTITALMSALGGLGLIPTMGTEINAISSDKHTFPRMVSIDEKKQVNFNSEVIHINYLAVNDDDDFSEIKAFCSAVFNSISTIYPNKKANRISVVKSTIYEVDDDESTRVYELLFSKKINANNPIEWDYRVVDRCNEGKEATNEIAAIKKVVAGVPFYNSGRPFSAISIDTDCNTIFENSDFRFTLSGCISDFDSLIGRSIIKENQCRAIIEGL
jgi:hypothetical protein